MELPHFLRYRTPRITRLGQFLEAAELCHQALLALRPLLLFIHPAHPLVVERLALQRSDGCSCGSRMDIAPERMRDAVRRMLTPGGPRCASAERGARWRI